MSEEKPKPNVIREGDPLETRGVYSELSEEAFKVARELVAKYNLSMAVITVVHPDMPHDGSTCVMTPDGTSEQQDDAALLRAIKAMGSATMQLVELRNGKFDQKG